MILNSKSKIKALNKNQKVLGSQKFFHSDHYVAETKKI